MSGDTRRTARAAPRFKPYPAYKDSGVEWLGEIPAGWDVVRVKSITSEHKKGFYTEEAYTDEGVRLARITDINDHALVSFANMPFVRISERAELEFGVREGDFLFARSGTIGRFGVVRQPERAVFASYLIRFRFEGVNREFLRYAFDSRHFRQNLISSLHGGANQNVHAENIKEQWIAVPPIPEQPAIAAFLDRETARIDALVAKKERLIELLQEKRTALITRAVTKGLDPNVPMKDSGVEWLGEIPAHWEMRRLKFVLAGPLKYGANEAADLDDPDLPRYVRITDIDENDGLRDETFKSLPTEVAKEYLLREGDLLFARSGATTGKTFLYRKSWGTCAYAGYLIRARLDVHRGIPEFIRYFTASSSYWQWLSSTFIQSTIQNVNAERYASLRLPLPQLAEQRDIATFLDRETARIDALIAKVHSAIDRLKELRTALISAAVTGKIDVRRETT